MMQTVAFASRKDAATELGFSRQRLEKLIKQGRIAETVDGVDMAQARRVRAEMLAMRVDPVEPTTTRKKYAISGRGSTKAKDEETGELFDYAEARARREATNAKLADLKLARESKSLISREAVREREFEVARVIRDRILGFPARVANLVPSEAMKTLTEECEQLIRELQDAASRIAEG